MAVKCSKCARTIGRSDNYVSCNQCKSNFHSLCAGLTEEKLCNLQDAGMAATWCCSLCKVGNFSLELSTVSLPVKELKQLVETIVRSELQPLADKIESMQSEIRSLTDINTQLRTEITKLTRNPQSSELTTATD